VFGGGADDVIYPDTVLRVAVLIQRSQQTGWARASDGRPEQQLPKYTLEVQLSADGLSTVTETKTVPARLLP
jgi:hypothetical protein